MKFILIIFFIIFSKFSFAQIQKKGGVGNLGNGNSRDKILDYNKKYDLKGRTLLNNPFEDSVANISARIVLKITVDTSGNVIQVKGPERGSTTIDSLLIQKAKIGALKAKFSPSNLVEKQVGLMSFTFKKSI